MSQSRDDVFHVGDQGASSSSGDQAQTGGTGAVQSKAEYKSLKVILKARQGTEQELRLLKDRLKAFKRAHSYAAEDGPSDSRHHRHHHRSSGKAAEEGEPGQDQSPPPPPEAHRKRARRATEVQNIEDEQPELVPVKLENEEPTLPLAPVKLEDDGRPRWPAVGEAGMSYADGPAEREVVPVDGLDDDGQLPVDEGEEPLELPPEGHGLDSSQGPSFEPWQQGQVSVLDAGISPDAHWKYLTETMKRPRGKAIPTEELEAYSHALVVKMIDADADDKTALRENRPGVAKLRLLAEVKSALAKAYLHEFLILDKLLVVLSDWLAPPSKAPGQRLAGLPNYDIRTAVLDALLIFPLHQDPGRLRRADEGAWEGIGREDLQECALGRRVQHLAGHPEETTANRHKAELLVERWCRLLFEVSRDYKRLAEAEADQPHVRERLLVEEWKDPLANLPPERIHSQDPNTELEARRERLKRRVRIPQRQMMDFHFRPPSQFTAEELKRRSQAQSSQEALRNALKRRARDLRLGNKIGLRTSRMSVEGSMSTMPADAMVL